MGQDLLADLGLLQRSITVQCSESSLTAGECLRSTHSGLPKKNLSMSALEEIADQRPNGDAKTLHFGRTLLWQPRLTQAIEVVIEILEIRDRKEFGETGDSQFRVEFQRLLYRRLCLI